ncbi:hypothetical protein TUSST3_08900 [Streptomyces sp. TUS-ST3]|nr:hypothetical protein TUSST3_08900 [Streptomyces sp. TUS-ST3]
MSDSPKPRRQGPPARYVNRRALALLGFSFRGMVPSLVIAEALAEKARREGRPLPPAEGRAS